MPQPRNPSRSSDTDHHMAARQANLQRAYRSLFKVVIFMFKVKAGNLLGENTIREEACVLTRLQFPKRYMRSFSVGSQIALCYSSWKRDFVHRRQNA